MLISSLALVSILLAMVLILAVWKKNQFHPAIFFLLFACVDVFFPAIYWTHFGQVNNPEWLPLLSQDKILAAIACYSSFLFVFIACMIAVDGKVRPRLENVALSASVLPRLPTVLWILLTLTLVKTVSEMVSYGSIGAWFWSRLIFAAVADGEGSPSPGGGLLGTLPLRDIFQATVGLAFFYRRQLKNPWLFTYLFPVLALALAMATFLRGAVLTCAITLVFAGVMQHKITQHAPVKTKQSSARRPNPLMIAVIAGVLSIYLYGSIRDSFRGAASGTEDAATELAAPTFLTAGHGLLGLSHIVAEYGQSVDFLWGKTYLDMMLLPVPRSIYPSKPAWYGIDDITRGMGWPESTQSAVTMPGEAFANFGAFGLLISIPLGMAFGWLQRLVRSNPIRFLLLGPTLFFQVASVTSWMSFTGIMNAVPLMALLFALAAYLSRPRSLSHRSKLRRLSTTGNPTRAL